MPGCCIPQGCDLPVSGVVILLSVHYLPDNHIGHQSSPIVFVVKCPLFYLIIVPNGDADGFITVYYCTRYILP